MADERQPTKQDLLDALERANKLLADQGTLLERTNAVLADQAQRLEAAAAKAAEQQKAIDDLAAAKAAAEAPQPPKVVPRPGPQAIAYEGLVRAKEPCYIGALRATGDVWHHKADVLWSDDPFEPVIQTGADRDGNLIVAPHPEVPDPMPFELRPRSHEALAARAAKPQRASDW